MAVPWAKIRAEWLRGGTTHQKLAEKYKVPVKTIRNRAYKEGWGKQKGKIAEKVQEELGGRIARARVNHLEKLIEANEALLDGLVELTQLIKRAPLQNFIDAAGTLRNAESVAKAIQTAAMTQRDLYRLPTIDQKFAAKKWKEQKKLEEEKLSGGQEGEETFRIIRPEEEGDVDG